ncbi:Glucose and ribitol dehydrogenase [Spatholobus suberectus]|nr:Glucose and ribitol dehydrogenase [Spatholobus suberectus]
MASGEHKFPPQKQDTQPGKEYLMNPPPQYSSPEYKPSNKLQGKIAIVTGGDSGIGLAVCNLFSLIRGCYCHLHLCVSCEQPMLLLRNWPSPPPQP